MTNTMFLSLAAFAGVAWVGFLVYLFSFFELRRHGHNPLEFDADESQSEEDKRWERMAQGARLQ